MWRMKAALHRINRYIRATRLRSQAAARRLLRAGACAPQDTPAAAHASHSTHSSTQSSLRLRVAQSVGAVYCPGSRVRRVSIDIPNETPRVEASTVRAHHGMRCALAALTTRVTSVLLSWPRITHGPAYNNASYTFAPSTTSSSSKLSSLSRPPFATYCSE